MPAALAVVSSIGIISGPITKNKIMGLAVLLTALPWLSVKYVPVTIALALIFLLRNWKAEKRKLAVFTGVMIVSAAAYLIAHKRIYGGWTVYAAGDHFVNGEFEVFGRSPNLPARTRRLSGLLFDEQFGLIPWTPAFFALVPSVALLLRNRVKNSLDLVCCICVGWGVATWVALTMHGWWWPGRQLVVVLPAAIIAMAILAEKSKIWKWFIFVGGFSGITAWLWIAFEATTDRRTLVVDFHETSYPVYKAISAISPDFTDFDQRAVLLNAAWLTTLGLATILTVLRKQIVQSSNPALLYRETSKRLIIEGTRKKLTVSKRVFKKS